MKNKLTQVQTYAKVLALGTLVVSQSLPVLALAEETSTTTAMSTSTVPSVSATDPSLSSSTQVSSSLSASSSVPASTTEPSLSDPSTEPSTSVSATDSSTTTPTVASSTESSSAQEQDVDEEQSQPLYRLYHPGLKVHLYTLDKTEYQLLGTRGWKQEGVAWQVDTSGRHDKVYRLYNPGLKVHLYTKDSDEYASLATRGWNQEGVAFYSHGGVPIYRLYHPGVKRHLYTKDINEYTDLASKGWNQEGVAFYGLGTSGAVTPPSSSTDPSSTPSSSSTQPSSSTSPSSTDDPTKTQTVQLQAQFSTKGLAVQLTSSTFSDYSKVRLAIWSDENGQDDLKWFQLKADGTFDLPYASLSGFGKYHIHAYVEGNNQLQGLSATTAVLNKPQLTTTISKQSDTRYVIDVKDVPSYVTEVKVPVWSDKDGQDDIRWYVAKKVANGHYQVSVHLMDHSFVSGQYQAHLYVTVPFVKGMQGAGVTDGFVVEDLGPARAKVTIENVNHQAGTFDVVISDIVAPGGLSSVEVPVWSDQDGQDDIRWYAATKQSNGTYKVTVSAANHKYTNGKYNVHTYFAQGNKKTFISSLTTTLELPPHTGIISVTPVNASNYTFNVNIANVGALAGVKKVKIAVWSEAEGQNDLRWYTATRTVNQDYSAVVRLANHYYSNGNYQIHVYYELNNGQTVGLGTKVLNVTTKAPRAYIQQELKTLLSQFHAIFGSVGGQKSLYIAATDGVDTIVYNGNNVQRSASTIKLFIMAAAYAKANRGELNINTLYTVRASDIVQASVSLGNAAGQTYSLDTLIRFMVETSDNTATNIVMRYIGGVEAVNQEIRRLGYTKTYMQRYMHDPVAIRAGLDNYISAQEAGDLIRNMHNRTLISPAYDAKMVYNLSHNYYPLWLPSGIKGQAHIIDKPGNNGTFGVENDVAVITKNGRSYAVAVLTQGTGSNGLSLTQHFARFGQAIVNQLSK